MKIKVKNSGIVKLTVRKDRRRGDLFVAESMKNIPFPIKRVYSVNNLKDSSVVRGQHAHKKTKQVIFCANGSFKLSLDDGKRKQEILLDTHAFGIILGPRLWHAMSGFSKDCVIVVFASEHYNEKDYIRSYEDFLKIVKKHEQRK